MPLKGILLVLILAGVFGLLYSDKILSQLKDYFKNDDFKEDDE